MRIYRYRSPIGHFRVEPQDDGRWALWFKEEILGSYHSPVAAADDVYTQSTGDYDWDSLRGADIPTDIYEWESFEQ